MYGSVIVTPTEEEELADYTVRKFTIEMVRICILIQHVFSGSSTRLPEERFRAPNTMFIQRILVEISAFSICI